MSLTFSTIVQSLRVLVTEIVPLTFFQICHLLSIKEKIANRKQIITACMKEDNPSQNEISFEPDRQSFDCLRRTRVLSIVSAADEPLDLMKYIVRKDKDGIDRVALVTSTMTIDNQLRQSMVVIDSQKTDDHTVKKFVEPSIGEINKNR